MDFLNQPYLAARCHAASKPAPHFHPLRVAPAAARYGTSAFACALCPRPAVVLCPADRGNLCLECDTVVHSSNNISRRHARFVLCALCAAPTHCVWPPAAAGANRALPPHAVCAACLPPTPENRLPKRQKLASTSSLPGLAAGSSGLENNLLFEPYLEHQEQQQKQQQHRALVQQTPEFLRSLAAKVSDCGKGALFSPEYPPANAQQVVTMSHLKAAAPFLDVLSQSLDDLTAPLPLAHSASASASSGTPPRDLSPPRTLQLFPECSANASAQCGSPVQPTVHCGGQQSPRGFRNQPQVAKAGAAASPAAVTGNPLLVLAKVAGEVAEGTADIVGSDIMATLPELSLCLPLASSEVPLAKESTSPKGKGKNGEAPTRVLGKRVWATTAAGGGSGEPAVEAPCSTRKQVSVPWLVLPFGQTTSEAPAFAPFASGSVPAPPPPPLVESPPAAATATTARRFKAAAPLTAPAPASAGRRESSTTCLLLSPSSNSRHQAADRLRRILSSWCAKLALRGQRVVNLALHVFQRALALAPPNFVSSNSLRVLLAGCLSTAIKAGTDLLYADGLQDVPKVAAVSRATLVEECVLEAAELQLMTMMGGKPLKGFEA